MDWPIFKPVIDAPLDGGGGLTLRICGDDELEEYRALIAKHHYLKSSGSAGDTLRYIAEVDGQKVALLSWGGAAYRLKPRDEWIGWGIALRKTRLKLVVQNRRFCMLVPAGQHPNLASQVLGACLRRLRDDWFERFGYKPLIAETFVDPQYAKGTSYKATNWQPLGMTAGSGRHAADFYQKHDRPKHLWCIELARNARLLLSDSALLPADCQAAVQGHLVKGTEASATTCQSLIEAFATLEDPRARSGKRYPQKQIFGILALGLLCGCEHLQAIVLLGKSLSQKQLKALGGWQRKKTGMYEAPAYNAYYNLLGQTDTEAFDRTLFAWLARHEGNLPKDLALDGKVLRGTSDENGRRLSLVALIERNSQRPIGQAACRVIEGNEESKQEGELTASRRLLEQCPTQDHATITADAMFTRSDIAQTIVMDKGADYFLAVKDNNEKLANLVKQQFAASSQPGMQHPLFLQ
jgi:hypothetical protein